jgi:hypothetical protein
MMWFGFKVLLAYPHIILPPIFGQLRATFVVLVSSYINLSPLARLSTRHLRLHSYYVTYFSPFQLAMPRTNSPSLSMKELSGIYPHSKIQSRSSRLPGRDDCSWLQLARRSEKQACHVFVREISHSRLNLALY